jgi:PrtD family type I secretion system ABC transporter
MATQAREKPRASAQPTELSSALKHCVPAFGACALFSLAMNALMLASPIYMLQVYDRVLTTGHIETLVMITFIVAVALAVMSALDALRTAVTIRIGCWLNESLGPLYLACGVRARVQGDTAGAQSLRDISQIQSFIATQGLTAFFDSPWVPLFIILIWMLHPLLGLVAISAAAVLFILSIANEFSTRRSTQSANETQIESFRLTDALIRNAEVIRAMGMMSTMIDRWSLLNNSVNRELRRGGDAGGIVLAITKFSRSFVQVAILGVGAWLVLKAELTSGAMIAASILLGRALAPVELAMAAWRNFMSARFAYNRLRKMIDAYPPEPPRTRLPAPRGRLSIEDVTYIVPATGQLILSKISFSMKPGEALAIIGPSGAGKSTLCRLLVGLDSPTVGEIRLDGSQLHHWDPAQLGRDIGFLPQDVEVFSGSVKENIARMQEVDDEEVLEAAALANAHEMIQHFSHGYDTRIGEGGIRLSGGQRQRIGLARAVFRNPRLIILDEPNANLDQAGEVALTGALGNLKAAGAALVIVGHRRSTLTQADRVLVLKEGCVAMFGEREEVLQSLQDASTKNTHQTDLRRRPDPCSTADTAPDARPASGGRAQRILS